MAERRTYGPWATRVFGVGTLAFGLLGGYGAIKAGQYDERKLPLTQACRQIAKDVRTFEDELISKRIFAITNEYLFTERTIEHRRPNDPNVVIWGDLKNTRDEICLEARDERNNASTYPSLFNMVVGTLGFVFCGQQFRKARKEQGRRIKVIGITI